MTFSSEMEKEKTRIDPLLLFFALTLAWTWIVGFIPLWCGFGATSLSDILFKALVGWKTPLLLILLYSAVCGLTVLLSVKFFHGAVPEFGGIKEIIRAPYLIFLYLFFAMISGPLNEEFGWRGFSLDHLFVRLGFFKGSLILGFIWGIWHFPWYFYPENGQYIAWNIHPIHGLFYIVTSITTALMCSVVYVLRNRSVTAAALVHMLSNFLVGGLLIYPFDNTYVIVSFYVMAVLECAAAAILMNTRLFKQRYKQTIEDIREEFPSFYGDKHSCDG